MQMMRPELAAVVARGDTEHSRPASSADAHSHRLLYRIQVQPVEHDFVDAIHALRQRGLHQAAERWAVSLVGTRLEPLVLAADLAAGAYDAAGERHDDAGHLADRA